MCGLESSCTGLLNRFTHLPLPVENRLEGNSVMSKNAAPVAREYLRTTEEAAIGYRPRASWPVGLLGNVSKFARSATKRTSRLRWQLQTNCALNADAQIA
jgi:hypothetical protein